MTKDSGRGMTGPGHHLSNLLATIHGDGGHYETEHGSAKAAEDAKARYLKVRVDLDYYHGQWLALCDERDDAISQRDKATRFLDEILNGQSRNPDAASMQRGAARDFVRRMKEGR